MRKKAGGTKTYTRSGKYHNISPHGMGSDSIQYWCSAPMQSAELMLHHEYARCYFQSLQFQPTLWDMYGHVSHKSVVGTDSSLKQPTTAGCTTCSVWTKNIWHALLKCQHLFNVVTFTSAFMFPRPEVTRFDPVWSDPQQDITCRGWRPLPLQLVHLMMIMCSWLCLLHALVQFPAPMSKVPDILFHCFWCCQVVTHSWVTVART